LAAGRVGRRDAGEDRDRRCHPRVLEVRIVSSAVSEATSR
jgi:hypothetical protein